MLTRKTTNRETTEHKTTKHGRCLKISMQRKLPAIVSMIGTGTIGTNKV